MTYSLVRRRDGIASITKNFLITEYTPPPPPPYNLVNHYL
jgi:hypothetical protein